MEPTKSEDIVDALKLLDYADKQKNDESRTVMSDKYTYLKGLLVDGEPGLMKSWTISKDHALQGAVDFKDAGVGMLFGYLIGRIRFVSR